MNEAAAGAIDSMLDDAKTVGFVVIPKNTLLEATAAKNFSARVTRFLKEKLREHGLEPKQTLLSNDTSTVTVVWSQKFKSAEVWRWTPTQKSSVWPMLASVRRFSLIARPPRRVSKNIGPRSH